VIGTKSGVGVVRQLAEQQRIVGQRVVIDDADRIAVGRRLCARLAAENACGAAAIFNDDGLPETLLQFLHRAAHDDVGHTAGRDRYDHADRPIGIVLRARRACPANDKNR